jgi:hypothetical protein
LQSFLSLPSLVVWYGISVLQPQVADDLIGKIIVIIHDSIAIVLGKETNRIGNMPVCMSC